MEKKKERGRGGVLEADDVCKNWWSSDVLGTTEWKRPKGSREKVY